MPVSCLDRAGIGFAWVSHNLGTGIASDMSNAAVALFESCYLPETIIKTSGSLTHCFRRGGMQDTTVQCI